MALEQSSRGGYRLHRTSAARTLDPSEKGAVNYFLGMTFCKLFAAKLLRTPWLLHLDVFRPQLNPVLTGRSRPDLVGKERRATRWHAFECKGRISQPDSTARTKAKAQAQRLVRVNGAACALHVGAITYFRGDVLHLYWRDPTPKERHASVEVRVSGDAWQYYYAPIVDIVRSSQPDALSAGINAVVAVEGLDLEVGVHRAIGRHLLAEEWEGAQQAAAEASREIAEDGYQPDGLLVRAGESWHEHFTEARTTRM